MRQKKKRRDIKPFFLFFFFFWKLGNSWLIDGNFKRGKCVRFCFAYLFQPFISCYTLKFQIEKKLTPRLNKESRSLTRAHYFPEPFFNNKLLCEKKKGREIKKRERNGSKQWWERKRKLLTGNLGQH